MRHKTLENKSQSPSASASGSGKRKTARASRGATTKSRKRRLDDLGEVIVKRRSGRGKGEEEEGESGRRGGNKKAKKLKPATVDDDAEVIEYDAFAFLEDFLSLLTDGDNEEVSDAFLSHLDYMDVSDLVRVGEGLQIMSNAIVDQLAARASAASQH